MFLKKRSVPRPNPSPSCGLPLKTYRSKPPSPCCSARGVKCLLAMPKNPIRLLGRFLVIWLISTVQNIPILMPLPSFVQLQLKVLMGKSLSLSIRQP